MDIFGDYEDDEPQDDSRPTVQIDVLILHTTVRAVQVEVASGSSAWIPRESILGKSKPNFGPGDRLRIDITEKMAEEKKL
jgi:hypothetical protein